MAKGLGLVVAGLLSLFAFPIEASERYVKRQATQLRTSYDFIIAGGGTTGLTIADRLSEAFPNKTVLVIEYGTTEYARGYFDPPEIVYGGSSYSGQRPGLWTFNSLPNPAMKNKTALVLAGATVGGSSAVNGQYFDRPSRYDFDQLIGNTAPEFYSGEKWTWAGVQPWFKKSVTYTPPAFETARQYGYSWNASVYGDNKTPIYSTMPPFLWADHHIARGAWKDMGIWVSNECAGGDKEGVCWVPISQHPVTAMRSHSGLGHYDAVKARANYHLLVKHQVVRVVYQNGTMAGPPMVEVRSLVNGTRFIVRAKAEVVISAGALHTPTILQRSGIGPKGFLKEAGIPLVLDLPGVGSNFQDHSGPGLTWNYSRPLNMSAPMPSDMLNSSFAASAAAQFNQTPARGPYTLAMSNSAIYVSLPNISITYPDILDKIRTSISNNGSAASYLPTAYASDPTLIAGYKRQLSALASFLANPKAPSLEAPFATGTSAKAMLLHPLSRGTVRLNLTNRLDQPVLDYRSGSNPIDFDLHLVHLKYLRRMISTPTFQKYGAVEVTPGAGVQSDAALMEYVKDSMTLSFMHPCCTAAMMPRELGGVVGTDLKVHGARGLRVADMSVLPYETSSHLSSVAYGVGEKAADIIIRSWGGGKR